MNSVTNSTKQDFFLKSALTLKGSFLQIHEVLQWIELKKNEVNIAITKSKFSELNNWIYNDMQGNLKHDSGKFFTIEGINIETNWGVINKWSQPIINQPEIGYLGFVAKVFDGVLHLLIQAKIEPGNIGYVQLSPTLQATKSNYSQVHKGKKPIYLDYFQNASPKNVLLDQLQSEQGARFLKKRNRNIIVIAEDEVPIHSNFIWLTIGQIKQLMQVDNVVNMDTRTVISGIPFCENLVITTETLKRLKTSADNQFIKSAINKENSVNDFDSLISFLTKFKSNFDLGVNIIGLKNLTNWTYSDEEISHVNKTFFKIIPVQIEIENREVTTWCQPMVEPVQEGLCVFICKEINDVLHFAIQAKLECGNLDIIEFAPTVQCLTGNYKLTPKGTLPFLEYVLSIPKSQIIFDTLQSEEGGRFYREQNRNLLIKAGNELSDELPENFIWMTLNQMNTFLKFNNFFNIQARSLIAAIPFTNDGE
jgi:oxidase EvaA